ncbi:MAG: hypothetical protein KIT84_20950 [Labilithrix sp.]|nr:hypothetical protein [Labilithrix sp.]MCW5813511.1 hypothetical protein [Labilithrix sp.]
MRSIILSSVALVSVVVACGGSEASIPSPGTNGEQQLQTRKDGTATGDGASCSWANTTTYDLVAPSAPDAPVPTYKLGDEFKSIDGCNDCTCSDKGIMCTLRACEQPQPPEHGCTMDAKVCPDGSSVGRQGPKCEFAPCPGEGPICTADAKKCPDGSYVGRSGPKCEFACPGDEPIACPAIARTCADGSNAKLGPKCELICPEDRPVPCTDDAKQCPDGTYVGRTGPKCEFVCPK